MLCIFNFTREKRIYHHSLASLPLSIESSEPFESPSGPRGEVHILCVRGAPVFRAGGPASLVRYPKYYLAFCLVRKASRK